MRSDSCSCTGDTLDRLLRPTVMAVLARAPEGLHGYVIAQHLRGVPIFGGHPPDNAGMYRALNAMETEGYLRSDWDTTGNGPAKRTYVLTVEGWDCLRRWKETLDAYARNVQHTVAFIGQSLQPVPDKQRPATATPCCAAAGEDPERKDPPCKNEVSP